VKVTKYELNTNQAGAKRGLNADQTRTKRGQITEKADVTPCLVRLDP